MSFQFSSQGKLREFGKNTKNQGKLREFVTVTQKVKGCGVCGFCAMCLSCVH